MNKDEILRKDLTALLRLIRSTANPDNLPETTLGRKAMFTSILTYAYTAESLLEVRDGVRKGAMERVRAAKALRAEQRSAKPDELPTTEQPREKPEPDMPTSVGPPEETPPDPLETLFKVPVKSSTRKYTATEKLAIRDEILRGIKQPGVQARLIRHYNLTQGAVWRMKKDKEWLKNMRAAAERYDDPPTPQKNSYDGLPGLPLPTPNKNPYHYTPDEKIVLALAHRALPDGNKKKGKGARIAMAKHYHVSTVCLNAWFRNIDRLRALSAVQKGDPDDPAVPAELLNIRPKSKGRDYTDDEKAAIANEYRAAREMQLMGLQTGIVNYYNITYAIANRWEEALEEPTQADLDAALDFGEPRLGLGLPRPRKRPVCRLCGKPGHNARNCKVMPERMALVHEYIHLENRDAPGIRNEWLVRHNVSREMLQEWSDRYRMNYTIA